MATSNLEIYEALKGHVGEEGARMIAEVLPTGAELATKDDLVGEVGRLREYMDRRLAELETKFLRLILVFFVPLWVTIVGAVLALVLKV